MERTDSFTTWLRVVIAAALAITLGTFLGGASPTGVVQAADVAPETTFAIDGDPDGLDDFDPGYGPGTTPGGFPTTGLYYNERSYDNGLVPSPQNPRPGCAIVNDPSTAVGGVKLGDGPIWPSPGSADPNGKTDLNFIDLAAEKVNQNGEIFDIVYVGYDKCGGNGTWQTALYLDDGDGVLPSEGDANGDYLFIFDFNPSSGEVVFKQFRRTNGAWVENTDPDNNTFIDGFASGDYGEVALNITELVFTDSNGVQTCGTAVISGPAAAITGGSLTSQVKDLVDFPSLRIDNCGPLNVAKASDSGTSPTFEYDVVQGDGGTVHDASLAVSGVVAPATTDEPDGDLAELDASIIVGQTHAWTNVFSSPDYDITEASPLPTGWELESIVCTAPDLFGDDPTATAEVVIYENGAYTGNPFLVGPTTLGNVTLPEASCTITNDVLGITIIKDGSGTAGTSFDFDVNGTPTSAVINGDPVFVTVPAPGQYVITEADINADDPADEFPDWTLSNISCVDGEGAVAPSYDLTARTATVTVDGVSDDIACTFTNNQAARIVVEKTTDPDTAETFDFDLAGPDNVALDGVANGGSANTGDITPGDYTITEDLVTLNATANPDWVLTGVDCGDGAETVTNDSVSVSVAAGEVLTCEFTNQQQGSITIDKQVVDPGTTNIVTGQDAEFTFTGDVAGSITTTNGVTAPGAELASNPVMPGSYTVTEDTSATPGYTLESVDCTDPTGDSTQSGNSAAIELGSGEAVSCTFTNSRNQATFTLQKEWGEGTLDDEVADLDASASGPLPYDTAIDTTSTSPNGAAGTNTMTVYSGQTITFSETVANGDAFTTSLDCGTLPTGMVLTPAAGNRSATLTVGNNPGDVTCTFTNTPKVSGVALQKNWNANSNVGDEVTLDITNGTDADQATSTAAQSPSFDGASSDTDNTAFVSVVAGETVTFTESSPALANYGVPVFDCPTATNAPVQVNAYQYTLLIDADDVSSDETIFCSFTNTRIEVDLVLEKSWVNAKVDDAVTLSATGSDTTPISYGSTANTATETDTSTTFTVYAGETLTLDEVWNTGDAAAYDTTLECVGAADVDPSDGLDIGSSDTSITCTWENARRSVEVRVAKALSPANDDGAFDLSINGNIEFPGAVDGDISDSVTILVGDSVDVVEAAAAGSPALANYTSMLTCDNDIVPNNNNGVSGDFVVPSSLASGTTITCTFDNVRNEAPITLTKSWGTTPVEGGDAVTLGIDGGLAGPANGVNSNNGNGADDHDATSTVYGGETISLDEAFGIAANADFYDTSLVCTDASGTLVDTTGELTGTVDVAADPTAITCTFTNQRKSATLVVDKFWLQGAVGDTADIRIEGIDAESPATGQSVVDIPTETDENVAQLTVWVGETVDVSEVITLTPPDDGPRYDTVLVCDDEVDVNGRSGTVTVDPDEQDTTITCTFRNVRRGANIVLTKSWADSPQNADAVDLSISGGLIDPTVTAPEATNSNDGVDNDADAVARGLVGETLTLAEAFIVGDAVNYDTDFECFDGRGAVVATQVSYVDGELAATLDITADLVGPVSCEFTNTRKRADFELHKTWIGSVENDTIELTVDSTSNADPVDALAPGGDGDSSEIVDTIVYAGESFTVSENIDPDGTNTAIYDPTGFTCAGTTTGNVAGDGVSSMLTVTAAEIDAANVAETPISCEFENSARRGDITIIKQVVGGDGETGFDFEGSWDGEDADPADFTLTPPIDGSDQQVFNDVLVPKNGQPYTITELDPGALYGTTVVCSGDIPGGTASGPNPAESGRVGTIGLDNGESITCLYTNTQNGIVIIEKVAEGAVATALDQDFSFAETGLGDGSFTLNDDPSKNPLENTETFDNVVPGGDYSVTELPAAGWQFTSLVCDDADSATPSTVDGVTATINVDPAEVVRCTYTNTAIPSDVSVTKTVDGGLDEAESWAFDFALTPAANPAGPQTATNTGDGSDTVSWDGLVPGETYTITEVLPGSNSTTYSNGVLSCSIGSNTDDQTVEFVAPLGGEGVEVTCSVTNTAQSDVSYDKVLTDDPVRNADGTWSLSYTLTVQNADDAGTGTYDLSDTFLFGEGVTIVADSAAVTTSAPGITTNAAFDGAGDPVIVTGESIAAGATHTYVVTVDVTIAVGPDTDGDCVREGEGGTGFLNEMSITIDGGEPETTDACAGFATLTLVKVVVSDDGGNATVADFPLTAEGPVTLTGISGTADVSSAVPAGSYTLSEDQLVEGYMPSLFLCNAGTGTVTLADGDNATCTITNDDEPVDLAITKNDDGVTAIAGGAPFDYTITVQNVGTRDADLGEPVTVVDELPLPLQWESFPANCTQAGQTLTCDIDPALMTAGGSPVVFTVTVSAPADAASGTYVNKVSVTTEDDPVCVPIGDCEPPPCPAVGNNNVDCEPTPVDREGAINIVKTDNVAAGDSVLPGEQFNYTLRVTNTGVSTILPGLVVTDDLPAQLSLVSVSGGAGWTCNNVDPIECTYAPSLAPGASPPNITVVVSVNATATGTTIDNTAVVQGAVDRECPEPSAAADFSEAFVPACNQVTDDDDETTPLTAQADLAIDKTASVATIGAGGSFDWVLVVENLGPAPAINVVVGDLVPSAVTVTGVTSSFFDCSRSGNDVTCTRPSMAVGASGTITIAVNVPSNTEGGTVDNLGNVESSTPDPNLDNNSDDASVVVVAQIPPVSVAPTIPATGSNSTEPVVKTAMLLLMLGALGLVAARRRRPDGVTPTA